MDKDVRNGGYFTVEMSMLMPFIIIIIFSVIYMCVFYHDRIVTKAEMYALAVEGQAENTKTFNADIVKRRISKLLIMGRLNNVVYGYDGNNLELAANLVCDIPDIMGGIKKSYIKISISGMDRRKRIMKYKIGKDIAHTLKP